MDLVDQMRALGESQKRTDLSLQAQHSGWATLFNLGKFKACLEAIAVGDSLYDSEAHCDHASVYGGHDPQVCAHGIGAVALCLRGCPDQGATRIGKALGLANKMGHPGSLAHALDFAATFERMCERPDRVLEHAHAMTACSNRHEFADYEIRARAFRGWAIARHGDIDTGLAELRASVLAQRETGMSEDFSFFLEMLAEVYALAGKPEDGLNAISEALQHAVRNEAVFWLAATKRRQSQLLVQYDGNNIVEAMTVLRESITIAHSQQALWLELQSALELAGLQYREGDLSAARDTLDGSYNNIYEGRNLQPVIDAARFMVTLDENHT